LTAISLAFSPSTQAWGQRQQDGFDNVKSISISCLAPESIRNTCYGHTRTQDEFFRAYMAKYGEVRFIRRFIDPDSKGKKKVLMAGTK